jgi:outer membrane lipoprotein-sorting protein
MSGRRLSSAAMMPTPHVTRLALLASLLVAPACSRYARPRSAETDPAKVEARILSNRNEIPRIAADSRATYYGPEGARKGTVVVVVEQPDKVRFEALSPTDDLIAILTSDGERFVQWERGSDVCFTGPSCPQNVSRLVPIPMRSDQLVDVLLGSSPLIEATRSEVDWDGSDGLLLLRLFGEGGLVQEVGVDPCSYELYRSVLEKDGDLVFELTVDGWAEVTPGARLPRELRLEMPEQDVDLKIEYRSVSADVDVDETTFRFACPEGTRTQELPCE